MIDKIESIAKAAMKAVPKILNVELDAANDILQILKSAGESDMNEPLDHDKEAEEKHEQQ